MAGDYTFNGSDAQMLAAFKGFHTIPSLFAAGNHDLFGDFASFLQRDFNYVQTVGQCSFFFVNVFENMSHSPSKRLVRTALQFLQSEIEKDSSKHKFIVVHYPIYSTEVGSLEDVHQYTRVPRLKGDIIGPK